MSEVLISLSLIPLRTDHPDLEDNYDNERAFMHDYFFEYIDFDDERIILHPFSCIKNTLRTWINILIIRMKDLKDSVDLMISKADANSAGSGVYDSILD